MSIYGGGDTGSGTMEQELSVRPNNSPAPPLPVRSSSACFNVASWGIARWRHSLTPFRRARQSKGGGGLMAAVGAKLGNPENKKYLTAVTVLAVVGGGVYWYTGQADPGAPAGRFVAVNKPMSFDDANSYCKSNYAGLASIHSRAEQKDAIDACKSMALSKVWDGSDTGTDSGAPSFFSTASSTSKHPVGCWIGLSDVTKTEAAFSWADGTHMDFSAWAPGEPSFGHHATGSALAAAEGEGAVHLTFVQNQAAGRSRSHWDDEQGSWNDNHANGEHGHNEVNAYGFYPLCQTAATAVVPTSTAMEWHVKNNHESCDGKYVAIAIPKTWDDAGHYCRNHGYYDLASIHSWQDQASAVEACRGLVGLTGSGRAEGSTRHACWIGMHDSKTENAFEWSDSMYVNYHAWNPGEPNSWGKTDHNAGSNYGQDTGSGVDENYVAMDFRNLEIGQGGWNDAAMTGLISVETAGVSAGECYGCYGNHGLYPLCERRPPADSPTTGSRTWTPPAPTPVGRFVAVPVGHTWDNSEAVCTQRGYMGLASVHTREEESQAEQACNMITSSKAPGNGLPSACWIGLNQAGIVGTFTWTDSSPVEYQHFKPGEPNNWGAAGFGGELAGNAEGEVAVAIATAGRVGSEWAGYWNDDHNQGLAGHNTNGYQAKITSGFDWTSSSARSADAHHDTTCFGCTGVYGQYALCQTQQAGPCVAQVHRSAQVEVVQSTGQTQTQDIVVQHQCVPSLICHQELTNDEGAASVAPCCPLPPGTYTRNPHRNLLFIRDVSDRLLVLSGDQPHCHVNMCHSDGDFTEVHFPVVDDMCGCVQACLQYPSANSYQYNAGGWCGCLANAGDQLHANANAFKDTFNGACALCSIDHMSQNQNNGQLPFGEGR